MSVAAERARPRKTAAGPPSHHHGMRPLPRPSVLLVVALGSTLAACASAAPAPAGPRAAPADATATLRAQTQEMLDAIAAGNAAVWDRYLDPRIVYLSEAGDVETKASLLAQLKPLPPGMSGHIAMSRFDVQQFGDVAIVLHVDEESEDYFGHPIHAQYMTTATWRLGPDGWKMIASQVHASLLDPPAIELPAGQLDDYVGTYRLTDEIRTTIRRDGDHLVGERTGRPPQTLRVEARDVLFVPGQPRSRKVFMRDAAGKVVRFADRREARDIVWTREAK
jgi:hypothetical protein